MCPGVRLALLCELLSSNPPIRLYKTGHLTDFTIRCTSPEGPKDFRVHQFVLRRSEWFSACLDAPFREREQCAVDLPEKQEIVDFIVAYLYDKNREELQKRANCMSFPTLLELFGAGDKYMMDTIKNMSRRAWAFRLTQDIPTRIFDAINAMKKSEDVDLGLLEQTMLIAFEEPWTRTQIFGMSAADRQAIYKAAPELMTAHVENCYIDQAPASVFRARCPNCQQEWIWSKPECREKLACRRCGIKHAFAAYAVNWLIERSDECRGPHEVAVPLDAGFGYYGNWTGRGRISMGGMGRGGMGRGGWNSYEGL